MKIRPFEKKDLVECLEMAHHQHQESKWSNLPFDTQRVKDLYLNSINNPQYCVLLVEHEDKIVGGTACCTNFYIFSYQTYVSDFFFFIYPEHRKGLFAYRLYQAIYDWAKKKKAQEVVISYGFGDDNERIKKFYTRMGYRPYLDVYKKAVIQ